MTKKTDQEKFQEVLAKLNVMTIYAVASGSYSDYSIRAMFSSREKAQRYIDDHTDPVSKDTTSSDSYNIEEYRVDEEYVSPKWVTYYVESISLKDGNKVNPSEFGNDPLRCNAANYPHLRGGWFCYTNISYTENYCQGTSYVSQDHAMKLAVEGRQAYLRNKETVSGEEKE